MSGRACALVALVLSLGLMAACDSEAAEAPEDAFYLEAEILVDSSGSGDLRGEVVRQPQGTGLRWWSRDPEHYRHEFYDPNAMLEWGPKWTVADGDDVTFYDPQLGSYHRQSLAESGFAGLYPTFSALVGPLPADSLDLFIEQVRERSENVEHAGTEEFLGRTVEVVEYGPTWSSSGQTAPPPGGTPGPETEESGGFGRYYVDTEAGFILRHEVDGGAGGQWFSAEVTLLDLDPEFKDGVFAADLPSDAVQVTDSAGSCSSRGGGSTTYSFSTMPLTFSYVPPGWTAAGSGSSQGGGCQVMEEWSAIQRGDDLIAVAQQSVPPTGVPPARADTTPVEIAGHEGYRLTEGDLERLLWVQDGVIVTIETNAATFEELLRIAESAR